jgi:hypothetical protein
MYLNENVASSVLRNSFARSDPSAMMVVIDDGFRFRVFKV